MALPIGGHGYVYKGRPKITYIIILVNIIVYIITSYENSFIQTSSYWIEKASLTPVLLLNYRELYRIFTSMFLHADIFHIFFNMYFLFMFGREVEKVLGSGKYLLLYLLSGFAAIAFHVAFVPIVGIHTVFIPALGASGAISGVLGAYLLLFPHRHMSVCWFLWVIPWCFTTTAAAFLIFWFALQVIYGYARLGSVAFFAHAGGFIMGLASLLFLKPRRELFIQPIKLYPWPTYYMYQYSSYGYPDEYDEYSGYDYYGYGYGRRGLGGSAKTILALLFTLLLLGGIYSIVESIDDLGYSVYMYTVTAGYYGGREKTSIAVYSVTEGVVLLPTEDEPRIVLNRLDWAGLLRGDPDSVYESYVYSSVIDTPFTGVKVYLELHADLEYDSNGVLVYSSGVMVTDVLEIRGDKIYIVRDRVFNYILRAKGPITGIGEKLVMPSDIASVLTLLMAFYVVLKKDTELVIE